MSFEKKPPPSNALDDLLRSQTRVGEELLRTVDPFLKAAREQEDLIKRLTSDPFTEILQRQQRALEAVTRTPFDRLIREQESLAEGFKESPLFAAVREQANVWEELERFHAAFDPNVADGLFAEVNRVVDGTAGWQEAFAKLTPDVSKLLLSTAAFDKLQEIATSVRSLVPDFGSLDWSAITTNYDERLAAAVTALQGHAQHLATQPKPTPADIEGFVSRFEGVAAATPAESRAEINGLLKMLLLWLMGTLAEDSVKAAARDAIATLMIFIATLQPLGPLPQLPERPAVPIPESARPLPIPLRRQNSIELPSVISRAGERASRRFVEFFTANIRNTNTRAAYARAAGDFFAWLADRGVPLERVEPVIVAAYVEQLQQTKAAPTVKQALAAIRMLFDWLVVGQVLPMNPASSVRGPKHVVKRGKTPVLTADQARQLLDSIDISDVIGLRDRALIGVMVYSFARVSATVGMRVEDYFPTGKRWWFRLHEKGGKRHEVPAHHNAEAYLDAYLEAAGIGEDKKGPLFRTLGRDRQLTDTRMHRLDVLRMVYRRTKAAGLDVHASCHTFRATGITAYLENGGTIEKAQQIAAHESPRTTKLYDRTTDELTLDEIERIAI